MTQHERKEIIQLNGLTILVVMALVANFLVVGFLYRYHGHQRFLEEKRHNKTMVQLQDREEHGIKLEIIALEGAPNWNATQYMHDLDTTKNPL
jgi:hypothetical protein